MSGLPPLTLFSYSFEILLVVYTYKWVMQSQMIWFSFHIDHLLHRVHCYMNSTVVFYSFWATALNIYMTQKLQTYYVMMLSVILTFFLLVTRGILQFKMGSPTVLQKKIAKRGKIGIYLKLMKVYFLFSLTVLFLICFL